MEPERIEQLSFVKSSKVREQIIRHLGDKLTTPAELSSALDLRLSHVSLCLRQLKEKQLIVCLNEEVKKGKLYELTDEGQAILKILENNE